jgi:hypothetical protein
MIENKVLVSVIVPSLEQKYDIYIPVNRKVYSVISMMKKALYDLSLSTFDISKSYLLYNALTGIVYDVNLLVRETDIRNGSSVIML